MGEEYLKRIIDSAVELYLKAFGAVVIEGAKCCGKTTTAEQYAVSKILINDPDMKRQYLDMAKLRPSDLLKGDNPRLIDEWQLAPILWDAVRFEVDRRGGEEGQFILTGSSMKGKTDHSGAGRIGTVLMRPMSLFESLDSDGSVSLQTLFEHREEMSGLSEISLDRIALLIVKGGWPESVGKEEKAAVAMIQKLLSATANKDMTQLDGIKRDPELTMDILRSFSQSISAPVPASSIRADVLARGRPVSDKTTAVYLDILRRLFIIEDLPAWNPILRTRSAIRATPKRHFVDPSIATAMLNLSSRDLMDDLRTMRLLFESLCIRDLRVYAQAIGAEVSHFRDRNGMEIGAIIHFLNGEWAAVEMKMGHSYIDDAAKNLLRLTEKIDTEKMKHPSFLMVITMNGYAYQRKDGVLVVPIGCLKN
jgi:predicted AAA+ superfamily ATPase